MRVNNSFEFLNLLRYNLQIIGLWFNSVGFIIAFTILAFMYYRSPEWITKLQEGALIGLMILVIFLLFYCLIIIILPIAD